MGLALIVVYLTFRLFRTVRMEYLLGFPIGFSFLAVGNVALGISYAYPMFEELASWLHLFIVSYGFAFLAGTYFMKTRKASRSVGRASVWLFSSLVILAVFVVAVIIVPPHSLFPPYRFADEMFRIVNLVLIGYILLSLYQALKNEPHSIGSMVLAGFIFLATSQYSLLLWALDEGFWSLALAHPFELAGLLTLTITLARGLRGT
jgi:hypothetical protein